MAESAQQPSWVLTDYLLPQSSLLVRAISFVSLLLGTIFLLPLLFVVGYDFSLWIWRHYRSRFSHREADGTTANPAEHAAAAGTTAIDPTAAKPNKARRR
ncbi:hypothetical protein JDV02_004456 [Purpureocillium takamizusanense]|uniref:Uncharacterized protein n=1 Tax=Purpureocillium takamizusanense TaxID=2060973 RepID=A0A9Q8QGE1_9HYPO|nr:uncharacterized protein JDV02_004456 [Purpureocillium takamizusanense]UNI18172.1 hypothetical protein JDV02_004456 [Purpureocillium takamizusanense]